MRSKHEWPQCHNGNIGFRGWPRLDPHLSIEGLPLWHSRSRESRPQGPRNPNPKRQRGAQEHARKSDKRTANQRPRRPRRLTPKGLHLKAQGRAAHPGTGSPMNHPQPQRGCINSQCDATPFGLELPIDVGNPGCAARPWALRYDPLGVGVRTLHRLRPLCVYEHPPAR
jgi:hypothetical protein